MSHEYYRECLAELFRASTTDESLYLPCCCKQPIPLGLNQIFLPLQLVRDFRAKEVKYSTDLWIDSLCIVQDDEKDWEQESARMHAVYASAYCTIAATSALDSSASFLGGIAPNEIILLQDQSGQVIFISTNLAGFEKDANQAGLSKRAWVMQGISRHGQFTSPVWKYMRNVVKVYMQETISCCDGKNNLRCKVPSVIIY